MGEMEELAAGFLTYQLASYRRAGKVVVVSWEVVLRWTSVSMKIMIAKRRVSFHGVRVQGGCLSEVIDGAMSSTAHNLVGSRAEKVSRHCPWT